jgi:hypothetical protein
MLAFIFGLIALCGLLLVLRGLCDEVARIRRYCFRTYYLEREWFRRTCGAVDIPEERELEDICKWR